MAFGFSHGFAREWQGRGWRRFCLAVVWQTTSKPYSYSHQLDCETFATDRTQTYPPPKMNALNQKNFKNKIMKNHLKTICHGMGTNISHAQLLDSGTLPRLKTFNSCWLPRLDWHQRACARVRARRCVCVCVWTQYIQAVLSKRTLRIIKS